MSFDELLKAFGEKLGGTMDLTPDESGAVALDIDEMSLTIMGIEEIGQAALIGVIGEPPPEEKMERLYRAMLEANHNFAGTGGATLSINPETNKVSLCKVLPLELTDGDKFFGEVERFVNTLETWRKLVEDFRGAEAKTGDRPDDGATFTTSPLGAPGFMQV